MEKLDRLQGQLVSFASLARTQFDRLKGQGIKCEFDS